MGCAVLMVGLASLVLHNDVLQVIDGYLLVSELVALYPKLSWVRSHEFKQAVATARLSSVTGSPPGSWRKSSSSSSSTAFSATGFLLMFLMRPTSTETPRCRKAFVFLSETNPGAGSTRMTACGPSSGCSSKSIEQGRLEGCPSFHRVQGKTHCRRWYTLSKVRWTGSSAWWYRLHMTCLWLPVARLMTGWQGSLGTFGVRHRCRRDQTAGDSQGSPQNLK